jgi:retron-type reverse transcriptase
MHNLASRYPSEYERRLAPLYRTVRYQQRYSLSKMSLPAYQGWQQWIAELSPEKPILIDVLWVFNRKPL